MDSPARSLGRMLRDLVARTSRRRPAVLLLSVLLVLALAGVAGAENYKY